MNKSFKNLFYLATGGAVAFSFLLFVASCGDDNNNSLPAIGGYNVAGDVASSDLVAYWSFDGNGKESKSGTTPTKTERATFVSDGNPKGTCLKLDSGYLAYAPITGIDSSIKSASLSIWAKVYNNKDTVIKNNSRPTFLFSVGRDGDWIGSLQFMAETGANYPNVDTLQVKGLVAIKKADGTANTQDALNAIKLSAADIAAGAVANPNRNNGKWVHYVITWDSTGAKFLSYANGQKISNPVWETRNGGSNLALKFFPVKNIIFGASQPWVDGTTSDAWQKPTAGSIDEVRLYKRVLTSAEIGALYELEKAGR